MAAISESSALQGKIFIFIFLLLFICAYKAWVISQGKILDSKCYATSSTEANYFFHLLFLFLITLGQLSDAVFFLPSFFLPASLLIFLLPFLSFLPELMHFFVVWVWDLNSGLHASPFEPHL
jgi:hypothetical protein